MPVQGPPLFTFGPRIIGEEAHRRQLQRRESNPASLGPKVLGEPSVISRLPESSGGTADGLYRIEDIERALKENPALYEQLYAAEKRRPDGPRKAAMRLFLQAEVTRAGGIRPERHGEIEAYLKAPVGSK